MSYFTENERSVPTQLIVSKPRRQEHRRALLYAQLLPIAVERQTAVQYGQTLKGIRSRVKRTRPLDRKMIDGEEIARGKEAYLCPRNNVNRRSRGGMLRDGSELCHLERLFDMEVAWSSVRADAPVVIDAVRCIRVLLYLTDEDALADCMERARRDEEHIPLLDRHTPYDIEQTIILNTAAKLLLRNLMLKALEQLSSRRCVHDVPHLRLAVLPLDA